MEKSKRSVCYIIDMKKMQLVPLTLVLLLFSISSLDAGNREEVRNYDRLRLLQQATGTTPSGSNSFETRVNTLLNPQTQSTPAYESQARVDYAISEQIKETAKIEASETQKNTERNQKAALGYLPKNDNGLAATNLASELKVPAVKDEYAEKNSFVDASEENFQKLLEKQQQESAEPEEKAPALAPKKEKKDASGLLPSLANNPFYFSGNSGTGSEADNFEINKPIILTRMVQSGIPVTDAEQILASSNSTEDVMLKIMDDYGKPYSEIKDITNTKKS